MRLIIFNSSNPESLTVTQADRERQAVLPRTMYGQAPRPRHLLNCLNDPFCLSFCACCLPPTGTRLLDDSAGPNAIDRSRQAGERLGLCPSGPDQLSTGDQAPLSPGCLVHSTVSMALGPPFSYAVGISDSLSLLLCSPSDYNHVTTCRRCAPSKRCVFVGAT